MSIGFWFQALAQNDPLAVASRPETSSTSENSSDKFSLDFYVHMTVHRSKLFLKWNQQTHSFPNLFLYKTLHVSCSSSAHHQELDTVHSALARVIQVWRQLVFSAYFVVPYHIATFVLYSFSLVFRYWYVSFACLALTNFTFVWPCIVVNYS